jgi:hypothetical protein
MRILRGALLPARIILPALLLAAFVAGFALSGAPSAQAATTTARGLLGRVSLVDASASIDPFAPHPDSPDSKDIS